MPVLAADRIDQIIIPSLRQQGRITIFQIVVVIGHGYLAHVPQRKPNVCWTCCTIGV
jgi:hypothetical protein